MIPISADQQALKNVRIPVTVATMHRAIGNTICAVPPHVLGHIYLNGFTEEEVAALVALGGKLEAEAMARALVWATAEADWSTDIGGALQRLSNVEVSRAEVDRAVLAANERARANRPWVER